MCFKRQEYLEEHYLHARKKKFALSLAEIKFEGRCFL